MRAASPLVRLFARNVRRRRVEANLTQEGLAELSNLHRTYVSSIERGERNATLESVERIARALRVDPHTLLMPTSR